MASNSCFILAFFIAISFSCMDFGLAARHLMQTSTAPNLPLPKPTLPPLPSLPTLPQGNVPPLPTIPSLPTIPTVPQVTLPPLAATLLPNFPTVPTTIPSFPFFSPPPSATTP
ncbi:hypothetical protein AAZX31_13G240700 [Glycine max]|uniref:Uncharacterized protein n=2 Tax=Glycine subgen. Soja TaxID=1462606 RepID=K7M1X0_SOYBN|nr:uncharacterized protein LOC100527317 precursor [Glycine max]XP_028188968.1 protein PELPK2-like [Glycine soja]KAG4960631.1 hypothetical protein JHK87_037264 [Glycine soja]KAG4971641.1 hypothetical protein JHK85_038062 [Glycine max]KAG4978029.1 hypothetical protein JHK86_037503 [Glycine max]KAG5114038.1 hypothetical protein JHK82_037307 [Glycine max]KAG5131320.1 hypothetical protein JHK84_037717 [Glycine max]|eukprot:NP_001349599.1 uncharacterized protein LOC100527317 precursor [Glycine max]